ncbi:MAG: hypothetical protein C0605_00470 [Hyphomicrobiales bacterium]|nr:MAG: hypothetical protein C0605_00470 [Hyphomicrobiales bacterium]
MRDRYVLIRPMCGLNDMFNQIDRCYRYCKEYGRTLVIDTQHCSFKDEFFEYFIPDDVNVKSFREWIGNGDHKGLSAFPKGVNVTSFNYRVQYVSDSGIFQTSDNKLIRFNPKPPSLSKLITMRLSRNGVFITFDFGRDYPQDILIHQACGGGAHGGRGFNLFMVNDHIRQKLWQRLQAIGGEFTAIHVRNTDLKTDYEGYFTEILPQIRKYPRIFLATDDRTVLDFFTSHGIDFHTFSKIISADGLPFHDKDFKGDIRLRNTEAILDALTLSAAENIIFTNTQWQKPSGFVRLAQGLKSLGYVQKLKSRPVAAP